jgi:hypothetical protein
MLPDVESARARAKSVDRWIARYGFDETALESLLDDLLEGR